MSAGICGVSADDVGSFGRVGPRLATGNRRGMWVTRLDNVADSGYVGSMNTEETKMTKQERTTEAERIAEVLEGTIVHIDADADFFQVLHTARGLVNGIEGDAMVITNFEWNEYRFEGF
jgi:hypothetical protein